MFNSKEINAAHRMSVNLERCLSAVRVRVSLQSGPNPEGGGRFAAHGIFIVLSVKMRDRRSATPPPPRGGLSEMGWGAWE